MEKRINVKAIADLAKLDFSKEELVSLEKDMNAIIGFAQYINEADISVAEELCSNAELKNVFREDIPECIYKRDELLAAAKTKEDGYITVPKVIED